MDIALKIDVDTHDGLRLGVPRMAAMLREAGVAASFFVAMGPDNSGKALRRIFTNRGFLGKMFRTRAVSMYGWRTILSGTLLPARPIALAFPNLVRDLGLRGFEVGVHGYDHVRWQDLIDSMGEEQIRAEIRDALEAYRAIMRAPARSFAAPGWRTNEVALRALDTAGLLYRSDTRGWCPFRVAAGNETLRTPEIPTTLPTLDEVLGREKLDNPEAIARFYVARMDQEQLNVHTVHAETEGMGQFRSFELLVGQLKDAGARFVRMEEVARGLMVENLPLCPIVRKEIPGRAGWIAAQGEETGAPQAAPTQKLP